MRKVLLMSCGLMLLPLVGAYAGPEASGDPEVVSEPETAPDPAVARQVEEYGTVRVNAAGRVISVDLANGQTMDAKGGAVQALTRLGRDGWTVRAATTGSAAGVQEGLLRAGSGQVIEYLVARTVDYTPPVDTGGEVDTGA